VFLGRGFVRLLITLELRRRLLLRGAFACKVLELGTLPPPTSCFPSFATIADLASYDFPADDVLREDSSTPLLYLSRFNDGVSLSASWRVRLRLFPREAGTVLYSESILVHICSFANSRGRASRQVFMAAGIALVSSLPASNSTSNVSTIPNFRFFLLPLRIRSCDANACCDWSPSKDEGGVHGCWELRLGYVGSGLRVKLPSEDIEVVKAGASSSTILFW
jgi:hypothetical protein